MYDLKLADFPYQSSDKVRYADTDRQGHVNNIEFASYLQTGRVEILYSPDTPILADNASFVIASLNIRFLAEIKWPGQVEIGTLVTEIGSSSISFFQKLYQHGTCVAEADSVVVQVDNDSAQSAPLTNHAKTILSSYTL